MTIVPTDTTSVSSPAEVYFFRNLPSGRPLRLGCRRSHLARAYARRVIEALDRVVPGLDVELVEITTSGDRHKGDLSKLGGKALFMKEIDKALTVGQIDMAVHCMKDVPGDVPLPPGLVFAAYLERDDVRDCVVWREGSKYAGIDDLPPGSAIGTSAVRRKAQILRHRPDLQVERFRGNVVPRITKLDESDHLEAIVLARGGLIRVGMDHRIGQTFSLEQMCPAVGAGVLGVQCRKDDEGIVELLQLIDHAETRTHVTAERTMLHGLQGHCNSPIAGYCHTTEDGQLSLIGMVFTREGAHFVYAHEWDTPDQAFELGAYVAGVLNRKGARDIIAGIPH
jgi:hydroxymethylbilane synthase